MTSMYCASESTLEDIDVCSFGYFALEDASIRHVCPMNAYAISMKALTRFV